jgi:glycosyltransferase involved in cell wall biosynthesis
MDPVVSVIICTYNQQGFVTETLESVLGQTYSSIEIIVADDGSTDNTPLIVQRYRDRYPDKVKSVLSDCNTGIPANINRGLALRTGELTAWLDGDDLMLPQKLEKQVAFLQAHPEALGCYHDADVFDSLTGQSLGRMSITYNGTTQLKQGFLRDWFVPRNFFLPSTIMAWSSTIPTHGYDERLKHLSEVVFFVETFRTGQLLAFNDVLVRYRRHAANITGDPNSRKLMYEYELLAYAILEARYPDQYPLLHRLRASAMTAEALKAHREGDMVRSKAITHNMWRSGAFLPAVAVFAGTRLFGRWVASANNSGTYARPNWLKRLYRTLFR